MSRHLSFNDLHGNRDTSVFLAVLSVRPTLIPHRSTKHTPHDTDFSHRARQRGNSSQRVVLQSPGRPLNTTYSRHHVIREDPRRIPGAKRGSPMTVQTKKQGRKPDMPSRPRLVYELTDVKMPGRRTPIQPKVGVASCGKLSIKSIAGDVEPRVQKSTASVTRGGCEWGNS